MKFQIISDLHLHFGKMDIPETDADCILIAGDLDNGRAATNWLIRQYNRLNKPIYFVLGNHEYYGKLYELEVALWKDALAGVDVTLLDYRTNPYVLLDDDILLLGDTLWTDFNGNDPESRAIANYYMNDFQCILKAHKQPTGKQYAGFKAEDAYMEHLAALQRFREVRDDFWKYKCVVMSHHAPSYISVAPKYSNDRELNGAYCSNLEEVMDELRVDLWVHGHTHSSFDYITAQKTRVVCNPRGYHGVENNKHWNPSLVVEVV